MSLHDICRKHCFHTVWNMWHSLPVSPARIGSRVRSAPWLLCCPAGQWRSPGGKCLHIELYLVTKTQNLSEVITRYCLESSANNNVSLKETLSSGLWFEPGSTADSATQTNHWFELLSWSPLPSGLALVPSGRDGGEHLYRYHLNCFFFMLTTHTRVSQ